MYPTDLTYKETARATLKLRANPYPRDGPRRSSCPRALYVHFCEIKIGSELALVGHSDDASRRALGPQRSGDAASSIRPERGRQLCMQPLCRQSIS